MTDTNNGNGNGNGNGYEVPTMNIVLRRVVLAISFLVMGLNAGIVTANLLPAPKPPRRPSYPPRESRYPPPPWYPDPTGYMPYAPFEDD